MKSRKVKVVALIMCVFLLFIYCAPPQISHARDYERPENGSVTVNGQPAKQVRFVNYEYDNNRFISLRDLASLLLGTSKQFELSIDSDGIKIETGIPYVGIGVEHTLWDEEEVATWNTYTLKANPITINEKNVRYYTFLYQMKNGSDCFISLLDASMLFDLCVEKIGNNVWAIDTEKGYHLDMADLDGKNYFQNVNAIYVGDATTGEAFFSYEGDKAFPIASTTKLMTCLLTYEAIERGQISMDDVINFSENVDRLAHGTDAVLPLYLEKSATVKEMLAGCLLPSSNEAALSLAEFIDGSEEKFVQRMNQKAKELGMYHSIFYNCNGLPFYIEDVVPVKAQNYAAASDMCILSSYIVNNYPQLLEISSSSRIGLESIGQVVQNTNSCMYNIPEMVGLKTGTTNRAGACLITASKVQLADGEHIVITVLLGAESSYDRTRITEMLARYAMDRAKNPDAYKHMEQPVPMEQEKPKKAKDLLQYCIMNLK